MKISENVLFVWHSCWSFCSHFHYHRDDDHKNNNKYTKLHQKFTNNMTKIILNNIIHFLTFSHYRTTFFNSFLENVCLENFQHHQLQHVYINLQTENMAEHPLLYIPFHPIFFRANKQTYIHPSTSPYGWRHQDTCIHYAVKFSVKFAMWLIVMNLNSIQVGI